MIFNSIKWRLQLWYGLILVAVLVGFGETAYQLERNRVFRRVDDELHRRVDMLAKTLHGPPHRPGERFGRPNPNFDGPPPDGPGDGFQPGQGFNPPPAFNLPPDAAVQFGSNTPNSFYFVINARDDHEIARAGNVPPERAEVRLTLASTRANQISGPENPKPPRLVSEGEIHEIMQTLPSGELIRVGCSVAPELRELRVIALSLAGFGGGILIIGLAGGWWFVGRALRPIAEISSTAAKISSGDLSQRINSAEAQSELGQLAAILNSTFARLETAFAQQKQFASDAAHELRTPVSVILTQTQMTLGRERDAAAYKQTVEACQRAAQRMRKLIETLLELARFDAGQEVLKRMKFDFSKTIAECAELVQPLAEERRVKVICELESLPITGDPERLAQVVTNLLTNAIQYNKVDGEVRLKLSGQGGLAVLEIADTGNGIAAEELPRVF